jgi:Autographiviridae endonuclease VII
VTKCCSKCHADKPLTDFYKRSINRGPVGKGVAAICKKCFAEDQKKRYDPVAKREYYQENRERHLATVERCRFMRVYGITPEQYDAMLAAQGGHCAICPATEPGGGNKKFNVDHDHVTGKVRGLLCRSCNLMLGYSEDSEERLEAGIAYLRASRRPKLEVVNG